MLKSESLKELAPALVEAQKKMGVALKDSKNPFFKSKYADLNAIIDAAIPALNESGIAVLQSPDVIIDTLGGSISVINTILLHTSGEFIAGQSKVVAAKSNDPQAEGSATTYARRYGLQAMVTLKAEDDDGEAAMSRSTPAAKAPVKEVTKVETKVTPVAAAPKVEAKPAATEEVKTEATPAKKGFGGIRAKMSKQAETPAGDY